MITVYINGISHGSAENVAKEYGKTRMWVYKKIKIGQYNGDTFSDTAPDMLFSEILRKYMHKKHLQEYHVTGTPLIKNPVTCLISSNWRG